MTDSIQTSKCARVTALKAQGREYRFIMCIRSHKANLLGDFAPEGQGRGQHEVFGKPPRCLEPIYTMQPQATTCAAVGSLIVPTAMVLPAKVSSGILL